MYFCNINSNVRNMKRFLLVLTTFTIGVAAVAQVKTFSLNHGFNHDAKVYDDTLFVACNNGLYAYPLKVESGTWKVYAFENRIVYNFVKSGSHLLAVTNENEVAGRKQSLLRSDDYGRTFSDATPSEALVQKVYDDYDAKIIQLYQRPNDLNGLCIGYPKEPDNSSSVFHSSALMESSDFGLHWEKKNSAPPCNGKMAFSFNDAAHMLVCGLTPNVHCSCPYIIETKDDFQNLTNVPYDIVDDDDQVIYHHPDYSMGATSGIIFHQIVFNPSSSQTLLAATTTGIAKSDDGGKTWMHTLIEMSRGYYIYIGVGKVCYDQTNPQTVYAVRNHDDKGQYGYSLYLSQDGGGSWQKTYTSQVSSKASWIRELLVYNDQLILIAHEDEVLCIDKNDISNPTNPEPDIAYRPMIEDDKVWKVGGKDSGNPVKFVTYYYFDGDTIIGGKTCKQMMCQRYLSPDCPHSSFYDYWAQLPSLSKVGAWYEEDKKVYVCREGTQGMQMLYDFSLEANDTLMLNDYQPYYTVGPKQTGGLKGFKGVYRDIMIAQNGDYCTTWLEGVGGIDGPLRNVYPETGSDPQFLMSCTVGDEVIYLNDEYEDGATPEGMIALKKRFDFTHTTKLQPKAPIKRENSDASISSSEREVARPKVKVPKRSGEEQTVYGEYNDKLLGINLDPLDDAYQVNITNESGKVVYEKTINAGTIVGLSIDISAYAKGRYTVTVENSNELFTGEFETETTGIEETIYNKVETKTEIYNLQGQRLSTLQKGLNIVNGKKVYVK